MQKCWYKGKLDPAFLDKVGFIHDPNTLTDKDLFKLEEIIEMFDDPEFNPNKMELSNAITVQVKK